MRLLRGSRLITDWESRYPGEEATAALERRTQNRVAARLVELSQAYGLASREMALVAVVKRMGDRAGELPETRVVPVGMPQDTAFGAYFHDRPDFLFGSFAAAALPSAPLASALFAPPQAPAPPPSAAPRRVRRSRMKLFSQSAHEAEPTSSVPDPLFELATMLEPDGGMPGADLSERAARTIAAVLAFVAAGHTLGTGAFRSHLARLVAYLGTLGALSPERKMLVDRARAAAAMGEAPAGDWTALALASRAPWKEIGRAFPVA